MTELDDAVRDALRSRSDAVVLRSTTLRSHRPRSFAPLLAAAVVLVLALATALVVAHRDSGSTQQPATSAAFVGYDWRVTRITDAQGALAVAASKDAHLAFPSQSRFQASDSVNFYSGTMRLTKDGFALADVMGTAVAGAGRDRVVEAFGAVFQASRGVSADVAGDTLTVRTGDVTLTLARGARSAPGTTPPSTTSTSTVSSDFVGYRWNVTNFSDATGTGHVDGNGPWIAFPSATTVSGDDSGNAFQGAMRLTPRGFVASDVIMGGAGGTGVNRVAEAVDAMLDGQVTATLDGDTLTLSTGRVTLTLERDHAVAPDALAPSATSSSS